MNRALTARHLAQVSASLLLTVGLLIGTPAHAQNTSKGHFSGTSRAIDGDTLMVGGQRVRLIGIDAPESEQTCKLAWNAWTCGEDAKAALRRTVEGNTVDCDRKGYDVYGRTLATCTLATGSQTGRDLGEAMLAAGFAIAISGGPPSYSGIEAKSRAAKTGIWASQFELPAVWRAAHPHDDHARSSSSAADRRGAVSQPTVPARRTSGVSYRNCAEARAAGAAPLHRGQPGYDPRMDGDGDGIACEPYRARR